MHCINQRFTYLLTYLLTDSLTHSLTYLLYVLPNTNLQAFVDEWMESQFS